MGCLNSTGEFSHWFGNIHLSGPCNRSCYFCIGQHMMAVDKYNVLGKFPLDGLDEFVKFCAKHNVSEVNLTGTNTDPSLYKYQGELYDYLREHMPQGTQIGIRTNGAILDKLWLYDKVSVSIPTFDPSTYVKIMGSGHPPDIRSIMSVVWRPDWLKVNIVLCPEAKDVCGTILYLQSAGVKRINLREPYGQPHQGNPLSFMVPAAHRYGMPEYVFGNTHVLYWDVHYVEVESVNLYANGVVSETYPITEGYDPSGEVLGQSWFTGGRVREQWIS